jgi:hypothetical protein
MTLIPIAAYEPDRSRYSMASSRELMNVVPVADGLAPLPGPTRYTQTLLFLTDADGNPLTGPSGTDFITTTSIVFTSEMLLPSTPKGGFLGKLVDGTKALFVGTATAIYKFDFTTYSWVDVTGASGPYSVGENRWSFAQFGNWVYAQNGYDPMQMFELGVSTVFEDNTDAPIGKYLAVVNDFLVTAKTEEVQWSALNDPQSNDIGVNFADVQLFPEGNGITGIVPMSFGAAVMLNDGIERLDWNPGSGFVFTRTSVSKSRGAYAPYSICSIGPDDFVFYAKDGFFRGLSQQPIGAERVDRFVMDNVVDSDRRAIVASLDHIRKVVWFRINLSSGPILLGYQWQLDKWCVSDMALQDIFRAETAAVTIDGADAFFASIDACDVTFDSSFWDGGTSEVAGIDEDGFLCFINGSSLEATITTSEFQMNGFARSMINGGHLAGDAANFEVTLSTAHYRGGSFTNKPVSTPSSRTKFVPLRGDGALHKLRTVIPAGESWTIVQGFDADVVGTANT